MSLNVNFTDIFTCLASANFILYVKGFCDHVKFLDAVLVLLQNYCIGKTYTYNIC